MFFFFLKMFMSKFFDILEMINNLNLEDAKEIENKKKKQKDFGL